MSSSEDETVVQTFINNAKKSALNPIETDVTDLVNGGYIKKDDPTSASAMKSALLTSLSTKQSAMADAVEAAKKLTAVLEAVNLVNQGALTLDPVQEVHREAQKLITDYVSLIQI